MTIKMQMAKTVLMQYQMEVKTLLGIRPDAIHVVFWQRTCPYFVHVLRFCVQLSLKVMN
jgi:hypothetical protein